MLKARRVTLNFSRNGGAGKTELLKGLELPPQHFIFSSILVFKRKKNV
jgi:hypothetical protein